MTPSHIEQVADRTGYWWLCTRCGRSAETERVEARSIESAKAHTCDPEEVAGRGACLWNGGGAEQCSACGRSLAGRRIVQLLGPSPLVANTCGRRECERGFRRVHREVAIRRWDTSSNPLSSLLSFGGGR